MHIEYEKLYDTVDNILKNINDHLDKINNIYIANDFFKLYVNTSDEIFQNNEKFGRVYRIFFNKLISKNKIMEHEINKILRKIYGTKDCILAYILLWESLCSISSAQIAQPHISFIN